MTKRFRMDIVIALITPLALAAVYSYLHNDIHNTLLLCTCFIAMTCEIPFLYENASEKVGDRGIVSGALVSSTLAIIWMFSNPTDDGRAFISVLLILLGAVIRIVSKLYLGGNFSHSVKIDREHKLITTGIYSQLRHPSYLGTLLIIGGAAFALSPIPCVIVIILVFIFAEKRVTREEALMIKHFGKTYEDYIAKTKKYFPYLY